MYIQFLYENTGYTSQVSPRDHAHLRCQRFEQATIGVFCMVGGLHLYPLCFVSNNETWHNQRLISTFLKDGRKIKVYM